VTCIPNSIEARDVASLVHMQTHLRKHQQEGPLVITRGDGCHVYDNSGREYIESIAGLWCASLGFASERLAQVAYEQMRSLGYYHLYRHRSSEPAIVREEAIGAGLINIPVQWCSPMNVRFGSNADIGAPSADVRFTPNSGHWLSMSGCPLCAKSGHMHRSNRASNYWR